VKRRERGLTLLEALVSVSLVAGLGLTLGFALLPLQQGSAETGARLNLDREGRRVLAQLRRELSLSGCKGDGTLQLTIREGLDPVAPGSPGKELSFRRRLGPAESEDSSEGWSKEITYKLVPQGTFAGIAGEPPRYRLVRTESGGQEVDTLHAISSLEFTLVPEAHAVAIRLELLQANPTRRGASALPPLRRVFETRVALLNRPPGS